VSVEVLEIEFSVDVVREGFAVLGCVALAVEVVALYGFQGFT
jgi:hypothetical protein